MTLLLGIVATVLTLTVAIYSATQENLPTQYKAMILAATVVTVIQSVWSAAEQRTFEKLVLGGESYVYLTFESLDASASKFVLSHGGEKYPVYDVFAELYDMRKFSGIKTGDPREVAKRMQRIERSVFGPTMATSMLNNFHPSDCYGYWMALVQQRNRRIMSVVHARKTNGKWESSTRVFAPDDNNKLIREYPTPGWETGAEWPTVEVVESRFKFNTPKVSCPADSGA